MSANFPQNREEAGLGSGPLQVGDEWQYKTVEYTWQLSPNGTGFWTSKVTAGGGGGDASDITYKYYASSCTRTVERRLADRFSLADFCPLADDATAAVQQALDHATATGKTMYVPAGTYTIHDNILVELDKNLSVVCEGDVVFNTPSDKSFPAGKKLFDFVKDSGEGASFNWQGGEIDGSFMPNRQANTAPDLMTVRGEKIKDSTVKGVFFVVNRNPATGTAGDTGLYLAQGETYLVTDCTFLGAIDAGLYISGTTAGAGKNCIVQNNLFVQCKDVAVISKREFEQHIITNNIVEGGRNGIVVGGEADGKYNPGKHAIISNNFCSRVVYSAIEARSSNSTVITGNVIEDFGFNINNGTIVPEPQARAIAVRGSTGCNVSNNNIYMSDDYQNALATLDDEGGSLTLEELADKYVPGPDAVSDRVGYGILIQGSRDQEDIDGDGNTNNNPPFLSRFNHIYSNNIVHVPYAICEADHYSTYNSFGFNAIADEQVRVRISIEEPDGDALTQPSLVIDTHVDDGSVSYSFFRKKVLDILLQTTQRAGGIAVDGDVRLTGDVIAQGDVQAANKLGQYDGFDSSIEMFGGGIEIKQTPRPDNQDGTTNYVRGYIDFKDGDPLAGEDRDCRIYQEAQLDGTDDLVLKSQSGVVRVIKQNGTASEVVTEASLETRLAALTARIAQLEADHSTMMGNSNGSNY